jgi:hypothetical protein
VRLKELQTLFYACITAPDGVGEGQRPRSMAERAIRGDAGLSAALRLQIYVDAYFLRLLGCLQEDFPATFAIVGASLFQDLVRSYLTRYPPTAPSIDYAGQHFAEFLHDHSIRSRFPFLADLARLEHEIAEVFVAQDAAALSAAEMRNVAPEDWPGFTIRTHPAVRILESKWKVAAIRHAVENGTPWSDVAPESTAVLIWRQHAQVYFRELEPAEHAALELASKGANVATLCETLVSSLDYANPTEAINRILARWFAEGVVVGSAAFAREGRHARRTR